MLTREEYTSRCRDVLGWAAEGKVSVALRKPQPSLWLNEERCAGEQLSVRIAREFSLEEAAASHEYLESRSAAGAARAAGLVLPAVALTSDTGKVLIIP